MRLVDPLEEHVGSGCRDMVLWVEVAGGRWISSRPPQSAGCNMRLGCREHTAGQWMHRVKARVNQSVVSE